MPLTTTNDPGEVDAFGVRFTMDLRGEAVRCHVFRTAIDSMEDHASASGEELLARFQRSRPIFEKTASDLYDAGHRNPWIEAVVLQG